MLTLTLILLQAAAPSADQLPANFDRSELQRCAVQTTNDVYPCLLRALGEDQARELGQPASQRYIKPIETVLRADFRLDDPNAPLVKDLVQKGVYSSTDAPSIILADFRARTDGKRFDYAKLAKTMKSKSAEVRTTIRDKPGPLPLDRCRTPQDPPGTVIDSCVLNADGTIAVSRRTPKVVPAAPPPGALPPGIAAGSVEVPLDQCKSNTPLPAGVILKACYKQPDGRFARQAVRDPNAKN